MSRSGYSDVSNGWDIIRYRGAVASALRGRRGQAFLVELLTALDHLREKKLVANMMQDGDTVCALGSVGRARGLDMTSLDLNRYDEHEFGDVVARAFGIPPALAREIMWENDEMAQYWRTETPEQRFERVRAWVASQIKEPMAG
jgi:hypothetical protein